MKRSDMCTKQDKDRENAFSHLFRMHLAITISAMVSSHLSAMSRIEVFFIKHELHVNG